MKTAAAGVKSIVEGLGQKNFIWLSICKACTETLARGKVRVTALTAYNICHALLRKEL